MEKDNKYYTPSIEEFHVGFEYEVLIHSYNGNNWTPTILIEDMLIAYSECDPDTDQPFYSKRYDMNRFRVKYLDKEDIELLGFECNTINTIEDFFIKDNIKISYSYLNKMMVVCIGIDICFRGFIKNKSELILLFKKWLKIMD